jgi:hypothetical protein
LFDASRSKHSVESFIRSELQITNQLVVVCKNFIGESTTSDTDDTDKLWDSILHEVVSPDQTSTAVAAAEEAQSGQNSARKKPTVRY